MQHDDKTTRAPEIVRAPELSERLNLMVLEGTLGVLEEMAREADFKGRYGTTQFVRAILEARIKHEKPAAFAVIKGAG
jgi:hypothetical protein